MRTLVIALALLASSAASAAAQPQTVRLSPTASVFVNRDPVGGTDNSSMTVRSVSGAEAQLLVRCSNQPPSLYVRFVGGHEGSMLVLRFGAERPDSFPQELGEPMKVWGGGTVRLVQSPPTGMAEIPAEALPRLRRGLQAGQPLAARIDGPAGAFDTSFETAGAARGLDMLSCLQTPAPPRPQVAGRPNGEREYDAAPVLLDSAAAAAGLDRLRPDLDRALLPSAVVRVHITAQGQVDSVHVFPFSDAPSEERVASYMRGLRFRPALREGRPVRSFLLLHLYREEDLPRGQ